MIFTPENGFGEHGVGQRYNAAALNRLNARFKVFLQPFEADIRGARVLDLASHDGRWTWAALRLGASHVTGIEARRELIEKGKHLFENASDRQRVSFVEGDIFDVCLALQKSGSTYDVILCLGIFYHVMDHYRLLRQIRSFSPRLMLLDTGLINDQKPFVKLELESTSNPLNTIAHLERQKENVVGLVSKGGLAMMCRALGLPPSTWSGVRQVLKVTQIWMTI